MPSTARRQPPPASADDVLAVLRAAGKPHTAEIYRRHGATGEVWGVSFADLTALAKKLKTNHAIARSLWSTGVVDAQTLALMVAAAGPASGRKPCETHEGVSQCSTSDTLTARSRCLPREHHVLPILVANAEEWARPRHGRRSPTR